VLLGSGNVATQLGLALLKAGHKVDQVYSRHYESARALALKLRSVPVGSLDDLSMEADFYILATRDDAAEKVIRKLAVRRKKEGGKNKLIVHTSGTLPLSLIKPASTSYGVLYPLQTLSKNKMIDFTQVPVCIEGNTKATEKQLKLLAGSVSKNVYVVPSDKRKVLHLAAVFACNFSNHMYSVAEKILKKNKLPFKILLPLIQETAERAKAGSPLQMQTGPAIRGDQSVMKEHLRMLHNDKMLAEIYRLMSRDIGEKPDILRNKS